MLRDAGKGCSWKSTNMNTFLYKVSLVEVERWLDAVEEMLSNDASGLGKRENLQEELNNCQVRQPKKMKTLQVLKVYVTSLQFAILTCVTESKLLFYLSVFLFFW